MMKTYDERLFPIAKMNTYAHYISDSTCNSVRERAGGGGKRGKYCARAFHGVRRAAVRSPPGHYPSVSSSAPAKKGLAAVDRYGPIVGYDKRWAFEPRCCRRLRTPLAYTRGEGRRWVEGDGFLAGDGGEVRGIEPNRNIQHRASNIKSRQTRQFSGWERVLQPTGLIKNDIIYLSL